MMETHVVDNDNTSLVGGGGGVMAGRSSLKRVELEIRFK